MTSRQPNGLNHAKFDYRIRKAKVRKAIWRHIGFTSVHFNLVLQLAHKFGFRLAITSLPLSINDERYICIVHSTTFLFSLTKIVRQTVMIYTVRAWSD